MGESPKDNPEISLIEKLDYITDLARRVLQPPPVLGDDPRIDEYYNEIRKALEEYGKSEV